VSAPQPRLDPALVAALDADLAGVDAALAARYPGGGRVPPVHTAYVPADAADAGTPAAWGRAALDLLAEHAPDAAALAAATGLAPEVVEDAWPALRAVLAARPVQDLRLDLEDGYGPRPDAVEDADAAAAGAVLAALALPGAPAAPALAGVRVRSMEAATRHRSLRSLDLVLAGLVAAVARGEGAVPARAVVTLAKVSAPAQVRAFVTAVEALEAAHGLPAGWLDVEVQVEVPALVVSATGTAAVAEVLEAAGGRCTGLHFGTYDFTAACAVPPGAQSLEHPLADHAKAVLQLAAAGTGVAVSDGSTNVVPAGSGDQVRAAWALHARLVRRALERGLPQGWDLHPGHLVTRHLATLAFYRAQAPEALRRLGGWAAGAGATTADADSGAVDEPATAQAMAALLVRGIAAGALDADEVAARSGVDAARLASLAARRVA